MRHTYTYAAPKLSRHLGAACHGCTKEHPGHLRRG